MLKLGGCTGGTTSTLPTGYQREPSLGSQVSMLLLAVPAIVLPTGLTRRSTATSAVSQPNQPLSSAASHPELICHPTCTLPIGLAEFQPRTLAHWHVAVRRLASARVVALAVSPRVAAVPLAGAGPRARKVPRGPRSPLEAVPSDTPPTAWQSFGAGLVELLQREPQNHENCPAEQH